MVENLPAGATWEVIGISHVQWRLLAAGLTMGGNIRAGLEDALNQPAPALVDLVIDPNALSIPPHIGREQVAGFALAATKIVLNGGVGKMLEMARSNLRNIPGAALLR